MNGARYQESKSDLECHAEREMKLVGLHEPNADYGGMLFGAVMELIRVFAKQGHSGASAGRVRYFFNKLSNFENLSAITSNPDEWNEVGTGLWQSKRNPAIFSKDGGKTHYDVNYPDNSKESKVLIPF